MGVSAIAMVVISTASMAVQQKQAKNQLKYQQALKERSDANATSDLRRSGHDALLVKESLVVQTNRNKEQVQRSAAFLVSEAIVKQAALGVTGNTAGRITDNIYGKLGDANTTLDLEERAKFDEVDSQLDALTAGTKRQIAGGQVVDFSSRMGNILQLGQAGLNGYLTGQSLGNSWDRATTTKGGVNG